MKTIYQNFMAKALMVVAASASILCSCDKNMEPYATADETDAPKILNTNLMDSKDGKPYGLTTIRRNENFKFDVIVTPASYTKVEWFFDGELLYEGSSIDMPLLAGEYAIKILATTTKGLSTYRDCVLTVLPLDNDPVMANDAKSLWFQAGKEKKIDLSNVSTVEKLFIGGREISEFTFANGKLVFNVPEMEDGNYQVSIQTEDGERFGLGKCTISHEEYVDPGVVENVIWEGAVDINWGDSNVFIAPEALEPYIGKEISLCYEIIDADYHSLRVVNVDWSSDMVPQVDGIHELESPYVFTYTAEHHAAVVEKGGMVITGFGYKLVKVIQVENAGAAAATLWEGSVDIDWGASNVSLAPETLEPYIGKKVSLYYEIIDAEYHSLRVVNADWSSDMVPQIDGIHELESPYVFTYTAEYHASVAEKGGMVITGFGYKLVKVTVE